MKKYSISEMARIKRRFEMEYLKGLQKRYAELCVDLELFGWDDFECEEEFFALEEEIRRLWRKLDYQSYLREVYRE